MAGTTPTYGFRYQDAGDSPNGALGLKNLADDVDTTLAAQLALKLDASRLTLVRKSADQSLTNSAAMTDDTQLQYTAAASGLYLVEVGLLITVSGGSSLSDIKLGWNMPSGANYSGGAYGADVNMAGAQSTGDADVWGVFGASAATHSYGLFSTGTTFILHKSLHVISTTAGPVKFQWAQNTATTVTTTVKANSWLRAEKMN